LLNFFDEVLVVTAPTRSHSLSFDHLGIPRLDLTKLGDRYTKAEVWQVIRALLPDRTPDPDRFMARFLHVPWSIIRADLIRAFGVFWHMDTRRFHSIKDSLMTLLPKTDYVATIKDYHPIALIHTIGKIFSKVLTPRAVP
jgi:hypothetical protein